MAKKVMNDETLKEVTPEEMEEILKDNDLIVEEEEIEEDVVTENKKWFTKCKDFIVEYKKSIGALVTIIVIGGITYAITKSDKTESLELDIDQEFLDDVTEDSNIIEMEEFKKEAV